MRVQSVNNHVATARNYQADGTNKQPKMLNQPSFGGVIIDERGMEYMKGPVGKIVKPILSELKFHVRRLVELASQEHDVLVHPFQYAPTSGGIQVAIPYGKGDIFKFSHYNDSELSLGKILGVIQNNFDMATTFAKAMGYGPSNYFWNVKKPLPEDVLADRFNIDDLAVIRSRVFGLQR